MKLVRISWAFIQEIERDGGWWLIFCNYRIDSSLLITSLNQKPLVDWSLKHFAKISKYFIYKNYVTILHINFQWHLSIIVLSLCCSGRYDLGEGVDNSSQQFTCSHRPFLRPSLPYHLPSFPSFLVGLKLVSTALPWTSINEYLATWTDTFLTSWLVFKLTSNGNKVKLMTSISSITAFIGKIGRVEFSKIILRILIVCRNIFIGWHSQHIEH